MPASSVGQLARFAAELTLKDIPRRVLERARACLLDGIGCILGARGIPQGQQIVSWAESVGGRGDAAIPGSRERVPWMTAAYASGCLINMLDFDDTAPLAGHPGAAVIPAVLTAAWLRMNGKLSGSCLVGLPAGETDVELLPAIVVGYEVSIRVARAGKPSAEREARVRGHSTWQTFGAAAAAGRMLGLSIHQMEHTLALAAFHAPVPFVGRWYDRPISSIKNNYGWVALGGVLSAILAREGWTGNVGILDGPGGFWEMAGSDHWRSCMIGEGLGTTFRIMDVGFKFYPACWHLGAALGALEQILKRHGITSDTVTKVQIHSVPYITKFADWTPRSPFDAQFSLPYASAMVLLRIPPGPEWFNVDLLFSPRVQEVMSRIEIIPQNGMPCGLLGRTPARVTVESTNRILCSEEALWPPGDPIEPLPWKEIVRKFTHLAQFCLSPTEVNEVLEWIQSLGKRIPTTTSPDLE